MDNKWWIEYSKSALSDPKSVFEMSMVFVTGELN
jgi:hypothetical protein